MTAVTFPLRPPRLAFAICGWRWQNDVHEIKYSVCVCVCVCVCVSTDCPHLCELHLSRRDELTFVLLWYSFPISNAFSNVTLR